MDENVETLKRMVEVLVRGLVGATDLRFSAHWQLLSGRIDPAAFKAIDESIESKAALKALSDAEELSKQLRAAGPVESQP